MKLKAALPLVVALILGLAAAVLVKRQMQAGSGGPPESSKLVAVAAAKRDVPSGHELTAEDVTTTNLPPEALPSQYFKTPGELVGRVTTGGLVKGQIIAETQLAGANAGTGAAALLPEGKRALTVQINEFSGVAGMLTPGSHVDVVSVVRDGQNVVARTIVQNLKVLAVGRQLTNAAPSGGDPQPPANSVTLGVTPEEAQAIQLATSSGQPWLALRGGNDDTLVDAKPTRMEDLRGDDGADSSLPVARNDGSTDPFAGPSRPTSRPADHIDQPRQRTLVMIRGTKEQTVQVDMPLLPERGQFGTTDISPATGH
jgi:pilus assembly protein CpaB